MGTGPLAAMGVNGSIAFGFTSLVLTGKKKKSKGQCQKYALSRSRLLNKETTTLNSKVSIKRKYQLRRSMLEMKQEIRN